ncbi:MAG: hypothetical protein JWQ71_1869 [Pedosphaera sp.]|nr:hypothetical protein [Pedosphaera sp.]
MSYEFPIKASKPYVCPPNAGPAWRAAYEAGYDMAEIEDNLRLTPMERLQKNELQRADHIKREEFLKIFQRGWNFIQKKHVNSR